MGYDMVNMQKQNQCETGWDCHACCQLLICEDIWVCWSQSEKGFLSVLPLLIQCAINMTYLQHLQGVWREHIYCLGLLSRSMGSGWGLVAVEGPDPKSIGAQERTRAFMGLWSQAKRISATGQGCPSAWTMPFREEQSHTGHEVGVKGGACVSAQNSMPCHLTESPAPSSFGMWMWLRAVV
ncbi:hypothetical protein Anapl_01051 [Anas platyrhynchos]|uniref:Uncharacterized protein n=1 Tax=Anas platyrhynchos TaxID=8839 RepID=R0KA62_ANAPL|nr:hypothetical protein Anapl_01051 [Anas platyrhynchos]